MQRVVVIGTSGSGKTTFANKLAKKLDCEHYELDELRFLANWEVRSWEETRENIKTFIHHPSWVVDGNYSRIRDLTWGQADTVIWLNYSFWVVFPRLFFRTIKRVTTGEELFGGCRETFRSQFLSKDSLFLWFFQTFWKHKKMYPVIFKESDYSHIKFITLNSPQKAKAFLAQVN